MGQREVTADMPLVVEHDADDSAHSDERLRGAADIVGGVAGVILLIVVAWMIMSMTGALGG